MENTFDSPHHNQLVLVCFLYKHHNHKQLWGEQAYLVYIPRVIVH